MTFPIYYALWYFTFDGEKSAVAISTNKDDLLKLHNNSILNPNCYYHKYKKSILKIDILPIQFYIYKNNQLFITSSSTSFNKDTNEIEECDFAFYSSYNIKDNNNLEEILIYLSKEDHQIWRTKYEENADAENAENEIQPISLNPVNLNEYYEEGIMNA